MRSEYGYRYQKSVVLSPVSADQKGQCFNFFRRSESLRSKIYFLIAPFDPWNIDERVKAELALPPTKIDLSRGAMPGYRGHVPRLRYRFGESYGSLSTVL